MTHAAVRVELGNEPNPPPHFAGRHEELAALNKRLRRLCVTGDPSGGLALIVGVPGAGKTQLGCKFAEDAVQERGNLSIHHLVTNTTMLKSGLDLFMAIARALGTEQAGRTRPPYGQSAGVAGCLEARRHVERQGAGADGR